MSASRMIMENKVNEELINRLKDFIEFEMRSCSMDIGCITPIYVQRMLQCSESLEEIEAALESAKERWRESYR